MRCLWTSSHNKQMEAKDGTGCKHVCKLYFGLRLVLKNMMRYNGPSLTGQRNEKWLLLFPKVTEEGKKQDEQQAEAQISRAAHTKLACRDTTGEFYEVDMLIDEPRDGGLNCMFSIAITRKFKWS